MEVEADEKERGTISVEISDESPVVYVTADVCDR